MHPERELTACIAAAEAAFDREMALTPDGRRDAERANIAGYVQHGLAELRQYGSPTAYQDRVEIALDDVPVPLVGYPDWRFDQHGLLVDLKTAERLPTTIGNAHGRQGAVYATITQEMHDAAKDFQAAFIVAQLDPVRAVPILRVPGTGREPELNERQLDARRRVHNALQALGGLSSPAGSCLWHVVGLQRSVREWAIRQGWRGRPVDHKAAAGILIAGLGVLAAHLGYGGVKRAS